MNELSLFSGVGGGLLGTKHLLGWRTVGYVEFADYPQRVLAARIRDGLLDNAPIFGDIRTFISEGYAERYRGVVDVIAAGFPCQPFSVAGDQLGEDDPRNMWPQTRDTIQIVRPEYIFLENVPGLISSGYIVTIIDDLREIGYKVLPPLRLSASDVGANHKRERIWIVAYAESKRRSGVLRSNAVGLNETQGRKRKKSLDAQSNPFLQFEESVGESAVLGVDDGLPHRVDRLKAIGNGQVPDVAAEAWELLTCAAE